MTFCSKCNFGIADESAKFCPKCGTPRKSQPQIITKQKPKLTQMGALSLICLFVGIPVLLIGLLDMFGSTWIVGTVLLFASMIIGRIDTAQKKKTDFNQIKPTIKEDNAIEILKVRLAKGEITKEEFDRMKEDLKD